MSTESICKEKQRNSIPCCRTLLSQNPQSIVLEAKNLQVTCSEQLWVFSQWMISTHTAKSGTHPSTQTATGGGMFQRTACFREKLKTVKLGLWFSFQCDIHVCRLTEKGIYCSIYSFKKNVNIGLRCSSLHTVQSNELDVLNGMRKSWSHLKNKSLAYIKI